MDTQFIQWIWGIGYEQKWGGEHAGKQHMGVGMGMYGCAHTLPNDRFNNCCIVFLVGVIYCFPTNVLFFLVEVLFFILFSMSCHFCLRLTKKLKIIVSSYLLLLYQHYMMYANWIVIFHFLQMCFQENQLILFATCRLIHAHPTITLMCLTINLLQLWFKVSNYYLRAT